MPRRLDEIPALITQRCARARRVGRKRQNSMNMSGYKQCDTFLAGPCRNPTLALDADLDADTSRHETDQAEPLCSMRAASVARVTSLTRRCGRAAPDTPQSVPSRREDARHGRRPVYRVLRYFRGPVAVRFVFDGSSCGSLNEFVCCELRYYFFKLYYISYNESLFFRTTHTRQRREVCSGF